MYVNFECLSSVVIISRHRLLDSGIKKSKMKIKMKKMKKKMKMKKKTLKKKLKKKKKELWSKFCIFSVTRVSALGSWAFEFFVLCPREDFAGQDALNTMSDRIPVSLHNKLYESGPVEGRTGSSNRLSHLKLISSAGRGKMV